MHAPSVATFMILLFLAAWAAAEGYVRRAHAHDAARARPRAVRVVHGRSVAVTALRGRPDGQVTSYPTASGPYR